MRWSSLAIAAALGPAAAGCNIAHNAARNIINEPHVVWTQHAIKHDLRQAAKAAWETSRDKCPEHADSAEFRDGFIDGYVDYLDRGGNGSIRAVPVAKYTRHKKYFTEDGQCVAKEYLLGFKLGQDIAISSGQRRLLTVPVLLPQEPTGPIPFNVQPAASEAPPPMIPPQPPESVAQSGAMNRAPNPTTTPAPLSATLPAQTAHPPLLRLIAKTAPPDDFQPTTKPLPVNELLGKAAPRRSSIRFHYRGRSRVRPCRRPCRCRWNMPPAGRAPGRPAAHSANECRGSHDTDHRAARSSPGGTDHARAAAQSLAPNAVAAQPSTTPRMRGAIR